MEAILSGILGSLASVFGKLSLSFNSPVIFFSNYLSEFFKINHISYLFEYLFRCLFFVLMLICNIFMMSVFLSSLQRSNSTLIVTALSTVSNFITTGFLGIVLFQEVVKFQWYIGVILCLLGSGFISLSQTRSQRID